MNQQPKYHRILLKLSGEALANGQKDSILDFAFIDRVAAVLKKCQSAGVEIGIIVGAGNIWRGVTGSVKMQRTRADHMGMLATTMNAIALCDAFIRNGMDTVVMSAAEMDTYADHYTTRHADRLLKEGKIVIFGGGEVLKQNGVIIGALGVSGGSAQQDSDLAAYGKSIFEEVIACL